MEGFRMRRRGRGGWGRGDEAPQGESEVAKTPARKDALEEGEAGTTTDNTRLGVHFSLIAFGMNSQQPEAVECLGHPG